jgi:hypothetical protein
LKTFPFSQTLCEGTFISKLNYYEYKVMNSLCEFQKQNFA